jgi:uncharacterized protein YkwD
MSNEKKAETTREAQFFVRPGTKDKTAKDLGNEIADGLIAQINEHRKAQGLPPLEKDAEG